MRDRRGVAPAVTGTAAGAAAVAYLLTALCCLPVALGGASLALASVGAFLGPAAPWLAVAALALLGLTFFTALRRTTDCDDGRCAARPRRWWLWALAAVVLGLLALTQLLPRLLYR